MKRKNLVSPEDAASKRLKGTLIKLVIIILIAMIAAACYLLFSWNKYQKIAKSEAIQLARSVEALLPTEHIAALTTIDRGADAHVENNIVEKSLAHLVEATDSIHYAYILEQQNDDIVVLVDSSAANPNVSSPTKRSCEETTEINRLPFDSGQPLITEPVRTPCGNWIRALIPIYGSDNNKVFAVLGLSYSAAEWNAGLWQNMIPDIVTAICFLILVTIVFYIYCKHVDFAEMNNKLVCQESLYRNIFEKTPIGVALINKDSLTFDSVNPAGEAIIGRCSEELKKLPWFGLSHPDDLQDEQSQFEQFKEDDVHSYSIEKRLVQPSGDIHWVNLTVADFSGCSLEDSVYLCLFEDITARKLMVNKLTESERSKSVFLSHMPGMAYRCLNDSNWTMEFVSEGCFALTGYSADSLVDYSEIFYQDIIAPEFRNDVREGWDNVLLQKSEYRGEYEIITSSGEHKWVMELGQGIYDNNGHAEALEGIILDITERKKQDHQITYLKEHDLLTGLYNPSYLEQEKKRLDQSEFLPLSIAICDIDGLRMINDAYGNEEGDQLISKTAILLQNNLRKDHVLGRSGGGEFMLLLPNTDSETAHQLKLDIERSVKSYNKNNENAPYTISVSIGYATKEEMNQQMDDMIRLAKEYLHRRKLLNRNSSHSAIVSSIMATLYAKSQETEMHGERLGKFCQMIGRALGLTQSDLEAAELVSMLHDIGKIGVDDRILNKPGPLNDDEWKIMKQHPEIGYRIVMSTPQLQHIAEYILFHHERWDGKGYPKGLHGEDIPLISRIVSVADAFDAMTEDRIYRKGLSIETTINEINKNAGTQFDPHIVAIFSDLILDETRMVQ